KREAIFDAEVCFTSRKTLSGDDYQLNYDADGNVELPACLDRRKPKLRGASENPVTTEKPPPLGAARASETGVRFAMTAVTKPAESAKWETLRRLRFGDVLKLILYRYGPRGCPDDDAGRPDLMELALPSIARPCWR